MGKKEKFKTYKVPFGVMCPCSGKGQVFYNDVLMFPLKLLSLHGEGEYIKLKIRAYSFI